jgi:CHAT domain-containing protein
MRSHYLEFLRNNDLEEGSWVKGTPYLVVAANHLIREFRMPLGQDDFLDLMRDLRYKGGADKRVEALKAVGALATQFLGSDSLKDINDPTSGTFPLQLDLVVNPKELAALPFEAATDAEGQPLFARGAHAVVLTRRVRHDFTASDQAWPATPRILYAWARPSGVGEVPSAEHEQALRAAVEPWIPVQDWDRDAPAPTGVLQVLPEVSLAALKDACQASITANQPFTHVHLLAHGYAVGEEHRKRFGLALHAPGGDLDPVEPEDLAAALTPLVNRAVVVTLAACDSASGINTTTSKYSIAHVLHVLGFPIVVASQLPLTVPGSNLLIATFYKQLLAGLDVREALHAARLALYESRQSSAHDWASLVGYAQLPEDYADHLRQVRLRSILASLKTLQRGSDKLTAERSTDAPLFDRVAEQLQVRIAQLDQFRQEDAAAERLDQMEENLGLLGSAEKRRAELCFVRSGLGDKEHWRQLMREALTHARDWYRQGYEFNISSHWNGVQFLSLDAVLNGRIDDPSTWHAALTAARLYQRHKEPEKVIWALGSLAELHLLAPLAGQVAPADAAQKALKDMKTLVKEQGGSDTFPLESTERQFRRYVDWWTTANGFFPGTTDLGAEAGKLVDVLRAPD